jgi:ATP-dependent exoDNAse (exonuclease V) beta subunit
MKTNSIPCVQNTVKFGLDERVADAADEAELDDIYETERRLLYVAYTRAREHLLLTGVMPTSEYLADFILQ